MLIAKLGFDCWGWRNVRLYMGYGNSKIRVYSLSCLKDTVLVVDTSGGIVTASRRRRRNSTTTSAQTKLHRPLFCFAKDPVDHRTVASNSQKDAPFHTMTTPMEHPYMNSNPADSASPLPQRKKLQVRVRSGASRS